MVRARHCYLREGADVNTRRMLSFCRAVERLTARDMRRLIRSLYPMNNSFDAISRDKLMLDILRISKLALPQGVVD